MASQSLQWVKVAETIAEIIFNQNGIAELAAGGKQICVAQFRNKFFAFSTKCPHASGRLVDGYLDALGNIVCPLHRYKFCLSNGRNISGEGYYLKHWPVKVEDNGVFVGFEKNAFFNIF